VPLWLWLETAADNPNADLAMRRTNFPDKQ
jgi:hypothetical protein